MSEKLDLVVFGATGFTGQRCCEYLASLPSPPRWAMAGRSQAKLERLRNSLDLPSSPSGAQVEILVADNSDEASLRDMVRKTRAIVSTVGPFWSMNGEALVKVCAEEGCHYADTTGEPWFYQLLIEKYHLIAQASGAIIIPAAGFDCVPTDLCAFLAAQKAKEASASGEVKKVITSITVKGGLSGGTLATTLSAGELPLSIVLKARKPYCISPVSGNHPFKPFLVASDKDLRQSGGFLFLSMLNVNIVYRTWGTLLSTHSPLQWGSDFEYKEFLKMPNKLVAGLFSAFFFSMAAMVFAIPPLRWLLKKILPAGQGPSKETREGGMTLLETVATSSDGKKAWARFYAKGDPGYKVTSQLVTEVALTMSFEHGSLPAEAKAGGIVTSALLGDKLVERLRTHAGMVIDVGEGAMPERKRE